MGVYTRRRKRARAVTVESLAAALAVVRPLLIAAPAGLVAQVVKHR